MTPDKQYIVTRDFIDNIYAENPVSLAAGSRLVMIDADTYQVLNAQGRDKGFVSAATVAKITGKRLVVDQGEGGTLAQQVGAKIRAARVSRGLSMLDLAENMGVSKGYIANLEKGRGTCSMEQIRKICDVLNFEFTFDIKRKYNSNGTAVK